jgi:hypothetical protein
MVLLGCVVSLRGRNMGRKTTPRQRPGWSEADLCSDSKTLKYEFEHLFGTATFLSIADSPYPPIVKNALVESFAIHCRAVVFFFFGHDAANDAGKWCKTDVVAADFFDTDAEWSKYCPKMAQVLKDAKPKADKEVAHITIQRREVNQDGGKQSWWLVGEIVVELRKVFAAFLNAAPERFFAPGVRAMLTQLAQEE